jgi:mono/diheme cytochrome c family protein
MPAYAEQIEPEDRWKVVHYVRALQRARNPKPEDYQP